MVLLYDELDEATVKEYVSVIKYFAPDPKVCAQQMYPFESTAAEPGEYVYGCGALRCAC